MGRGKGEVWHWDQLSSLIVTMHLPEDSRSQVCEHWWDRRHLTHPSLIDSDFYHESLINDNKTAKPKCLPLSWDCFVLSNVASLVRTVPKKNAALTYQRDPREGPEDLGAAPSCTERSWVQCCPLPGVHWFLQHLPLTFHFPEGFWASRAPNESRVLLAVPAIPTPNQTFLPRHPEKSLRPAKFSLPLMPYMSSVYQPAPPLLLSPGPSGLTSALLLLGCCKKRWQSQAGMSSGVFLQQHLIGIQAALLLADEPHLQSFPT